METLTPHPRNPRRGDVDEIEASLSRFGQQRAILVDADGRIVAGNHTYQAAKRRDWTHIAAVTTDLTDDGEIERYLVADNRTSDLGSYENVQLRALLADVAVLDGTGYDDGDRELLAALTAVPPVRQHEEMALRMILRYDRATYEAMTRRMDELAAEYGVETYSEVVERAVTDAAA